MKRIGVSYWARVPMLIVSVVLVVACTVPAPAVPQRTYERTAPAELYAALEKALIDAGYSIAIRDTNRGFFQTAWKEASLTSPRAMHERRRYSASFDAELLHVRSRLFLTLTVENRLPTDANWTAQKIARESDPEYNRILQNLDQAVQDRGRQGTNLRGGSGR
jgi:uncharacterized lipoprotein